MFFLISRPPSIPLRCRFEPFEVEEGDLLFFYPFALHRATVDQMKDPRNEKSRSINGEVVHRSSLEDYEENVDWLKQLPFCGSFEDHRAKRLMRHNTLLHLHSHEEL